MRSTLEKVKIYFDNDPEEVEPKYSDEIIEIITSVPSKVKNISDDRGILPPIILNELSKMLYKMKLIKYQDFKVYQTFKEDCIGKQIILPIKTLNDKYSVEFIDRLTNKFDCVLICIPYFQNLFSNTCYVVTINNPEVKLKKVLTNELSLMFMHYISHRRSKANLEIYSKYTFDYLQFLSLANGYSKSD